MLTALYTQCIVSLMNSATNTVLASIAPTSRVFVTKGCKSRGVTKGSTAIVKTVESLGAEYGHNVKVTLYFVNSFLSGKTLAFYVRHVNRLGDASIAMNDGRPENRIEVRRA